MNDANITRFTESSWQLLFYSLTTAMTFEVIFFNDCCPYFYYPSSVWKGKLQLIMFLLVILFIL